jgi:hypothetical protein
VLKTLIGFGGTNNTFNRVTDDALNKLNKSLYGLNTIIQNEKTTEAVRQSSIKEYNKLFDKLQEELKKTPTHKRSIYLQDNFHNLSPVQGGYIVVGMNKDGSPNAIPLFKQNEDGSAEAEINEAVLTALEPFLADKMIHVNGNTLKNNEGVSLPIKLKDGKV